MTRECRSYLVSGGEYIVYRLIVSAPSEKDAEEFARAQWLGSGWDAWKLCDALDEPLIQCEGESQW